MRTRFQPRAFARVVIAWQRRAGRHGLPWQNSRDAYRIWLSEVMLQQTQVGAAIPYYERFLRRYPDVAALAAAPLEDVLAQWSGLGYYARARNLHRAAGLIQAECGGVFPRTAGELQRLPGIGESTAAAIAVFAEGERAAILDGNVKRVLARCFGVEGYPGERAVLQSLWTLARALVPLRGVEAYTQGLMDLGAEVCLRARPRCGECPLAGRCVAYGAGSVDRIPAARPPAKRPLRRETWLILSSGNRVLMERRPESGVWGGLWSFPVLAGRDAARACRDTLGTPIVSATKLAPFEHGFTHFRLRIAPLLCAVRTVPQRAAGSSGAGALRWFDLEGAGRAAIPAPVRQLLSRLAAPGQARPTAQARRTGAPGARPRRRVRAAPA